MVLLSGKMKSAKVQMQSAFAQNVQKYVFAQTVVRSGRIMLHCPVVLQRKEIKGRSSTKCIIITRITENRQKKFVLAPLAVFV